MNDNIKNKLALLPDSPGCYIMKSNNEILYVGKAKNLKNRVKSYFQGNLLPKVAAMVSRVEDFDILLCQSNFEALTLESNLIKKHRPFYNILLKDDKQYPYIKLTTNENFPRLEMAYRVKDKKDKYYGPYLGGYVIRHILSEMSRFFHLRTCRLSLPLKTPKRPCIQYQIGQCDAPCAGMISQEEYQETVKAVMAFLGGDRKPITKQLENEMLEASMHMRYEQAAIIRDKIKAIDQIMEKQNAISLKATEMDIIAIIQDEKDAFVQMMRVSKGLLHDGKHFLFSDCGETPKESILQQFILQYYTVKEQIPKTIVLEIPCEDLTLMQEWLNEKKAGSKIIVPQKGDKYALVQIAKKNAENTLARHHQQKLNHFSRTTLAMQELKDGLNLPTLPMRIEGFDISNTQGNQSVASMVVFEGGLPKKKDYRIFKIKTVEGPNDFASMAEVIQRRFLRATEEIKERKEKGLDIKAGSFSALPDVILIDGGIEQLAFAQHAMKSCGYDIPMFGLAKKQEEVFLPNSNIPIILPRRKNALHLITHVRDEAHRFGLTHHRALRNKKGLSSKLDEISGLGDKKKLALLKYFGSVKAIFMASEEELCKVEGIGAVLAKEIRDFKK